MLEQNRTGTPILLWAFSLAHAAAGVWLLWRGIATSFDGPFVLAALFGPLLLAHGLAVALRRAAFDRRSASAVAVVLRVLGGLGLAAGAMAMRIDLDAALWVIGVGAAVAMWGVAYAHVVGRHGHVFAAS